MDPLAHSLVGAALAETGLKRSTALATGTLIIGANLPDLDAVMMLLGEDAALWHRRGLTHGVLGLVLLPWLLWGGVLLYDWLRRRRDAARGPPPDARVLLALAYLGVLSHPLLDWLNTYGVRVLMPFSQRWFYGDTLLIVDPWMWLLAGCGVVLARSKSRRGVAGWVLLGAATTALILLSGEAPVWVSVGWCLAIAALAIARIRLGGAPRVEPLATLGLSVLALCGVGMYAGGRLAERQALEWLRVQGLAVERVMANPEPGTPFVREVVAVGQERYHFVRVGWFDEVPVRFSSVAMPRPAPDDRVVQAALQAPAIRGFAHWTRFPSPRVEAREDGYLVILYDVRYSRGEEGGIGSARVELDSELNPR